MLSETYYTVEVKLSPKGWEIVYQGTFRSNAFRAHARAIDTGRDSRFWAETERPKGFQQTHIRNF